MNENLPGNDWQSETVTLPMAGGLLRVTMYYHPIELVDRPSGKSGAAVAEYGPSVPDGMVPVFRQYTPLEAQATADQYGCILPTAKLVDYWFNQKLSTMTAADPVFNIRGTLVALAHPAELMTELLRTNEVHPGDFWSLAAMANVGKYWVLDSQLSPLEPGLAFNYGWYCKQSWATGVPELEALSSRRWRVAQPVISKYSRHVHNVYHTDPSQVGLMVSDTCYWTGTSESRTMQLSNILTDNDLAPAVNHRGILRELRYRE